MTVFMFPGQGSQFVGMGKQLYQDYDFVRDLFAEADEALVTPLSNIIFEGPADLLQQTENAQPALLTVSVALERILQKHDINPTAVAGHSLGEYSALVTAGSLDFADAVRVVRLRGQYMQQAVPLGQGGMMAVLGLNQQQVEQGCSQAVASGIVEIANINCPGQIVVAGQTLALEKAQHYFKELGARRCIPLSVSAPFHCSLMQPAGVKLNQVLGEVEIKSPGVSLVNNVSADYVHSADEIQTALVRQVASPVLWKQSVQKLIQDGHELFVEVGPGQVLTGLLKRINKQVRGVSFGDLKEPEKIIAMLKE